MGANLHADGVCSFRVWAPHASAVEVVGSFTEWAEHALSLASEGNGYWSADVVGAGPDLPYKFRIQNRGGSPHNPGHQVWRVDPYARDVQNSGEEANGFIIDPSFRFSPFRTPAFSDFILYELHVGSFCGFGDGIDVGDDHIATVRDLVSKLGYIRELGFNAVALMPTEQTLSDVGLGYAPTNWFAPDEEYGSPTDLRRLVDEAHRHGLAVIFDVVYNHASVNDNRYWEFDGMTFDGGIYFEHGGDTPFGRAPAHWKHEIRDFFLDNARMFFNEYHVDGLRFDAVHLIQDDSVRHILSGLRHEFPDKYLIAEYFKTAPDPIRSLGFGAVWDGAAPTAFRDAAGGNDPLGKVKSFLGWWPFDGPWNFVRYLLGSHDQVGDITSGDTGANRYFVELFGGRGNWYARAKARLGWALNVAAPGTPMLFMGSECHMWGYWAPDPDRNGDHRFNWHIAGDPTGMEMRRMVADVNQVRWNNPALRSPSLQIVHEDSHNQVLAFKRWDLHGNIVLTVVNLGNGQWQSGEYAVRMGGEHGAWEEIFNSQAPQYGGWAGSGNYGARPVVQRDGRLYLNLPKWSVLMFRKT